MTTELVPKQIKPSEIFVPKGLDVILNGVNAKVKEFNSQDLNIDDKKDRDKIRSFSSDVAKSKTFIDKARIVFVRERKDELKVIDTEAKRFRDKMDEIKTEVRKPLTDWEDVEKEQIEKEEREQEMIDWHTEALGMHDLFKREEAMKKQQAEMDAKQAEFDRIAKEQKLEKERLEREEKLKKEAAEQAEKQAEIDRLEAERKLEEEKNRRIREAEEAKKKRVAEKEQAEKEKQDAIDKLEREKQEEIDQMKRDQEEKDEKERKRIADEKAETDRLQKIEDERQADVDHRKKVNNNIVKCLGKFKIDKNVSEDIVKSIVKNEIPGLSVNY